MWRSFQLRLELPAPSLAEAVAWGQRFEERSGLMLGLSSKALQAALRGLSYAELEELCRDIERRAVLDGADAKISSIARAVLNQWKARGAVRKE